MSHEAHLRSTHVRARVISHHSEICLESMDNLGYITWLYQLPRDNRRPLAVGTVSAMAHPPDVLHIFGERAVMGMADSCLNERVSEAGAGKYRLSEVRYMSSTQEQATACSKVDVHDLMTWRVLI